MGTLSKGIKTRMAECLADHAFKDKLKATSDAVLALSDELYTHVFGAENVKLIEQLPPEYFVNDEVFYFSVNGQVHCVTMREKRAIPQNAVRAYRSQIPSVSMSDEVVRKYVDAVGAREKVRAEYCDAQVKAEAAMAKVRTFAQLWKLWPESRSVIGRFEQTSERVLLPTVAIDNLNKELGLPASKQCANSNQVNCDTRNG